MKGRSSAPTNAPSVIPMYPAKTLTVNSLIALFELANIPNFACSRIVACVPRSQDATELAVIRNLGWCGFALSTLQPWSRERLPGSSLSAKWLFLSAEV